MSCAVSAGPFPQQLIRESLFRARGDMTSGEIKQVKEVDSVKAELPLFVSEEEAPDIYKMAEDDNVEIGPFAVRHWRSVVELCIMCSMQADLTSFETYALPHLAMINLDVT